MAELPTAGVWLKHNYNTKRKVSVRGQFVGQTDELTDGLQHYLIPPSLP